MQCPLCQKQTMVLADLAPGLAGLTCGACAGVWVDRARYDAWRATLPGDLPETATPLREEVAETRQAKICPQCGHLLLPYRVGHGLAFAIDYCGACGGIWCDPGEWDAIQAKNLHDNLHDIVSRHWQAAVRQAAVREAVEQTYVRHLGAAYPKAREIKAWLHEQPQRDLIWAYLTESQRER